MQIIGQIQGWIIIGLWMLALAAEVYALVHAARQRPDAFEAAGKKTKTFWVAALAIATLMGFAGTAYAFFGIVGIIIAGVYLADVKPAIDTIMGRRR